MHKRILAGLLCLLMVVAMLPLGASAASDAEKQQVKRNIINDYNSSRYASQMRYMGGYCGLMSSWQLYFRGINAYLQTNDGNRQYDFYKDMEETSGGYSVKAYSAKNYTLEEALNKVSAYGTRDVYNILVGFQKTNTQEGAIYGHALLIYAILDGIVYFTEGFSTSLGTIPGQPICISIAEFVQYYDDWTVFEGIIVFGQEDYLDACTAYACNMLAEVVDKTQLLSQPAPEGQEQSRVLRTVRSGERLLVTGVYQDPAKRYYYRVDDSGTTGYVFAAMLTPEQFLWDSICLYNGSLAGGIIHGEYTDAVAVQAEIRSLDQSLCRSQSLTKNSGQFDLKKDFYDQVLNLSTLPEGAYRLTIQATGRNFYLVDGQLAMVKEDIALVDQGFHVGEPSSVIPEERVTEEPITDGWFYRQGKLYCYQDGCPATGWMRYHGMDYYLQEDGSVTTGWATVDGKERFFSNTGVMQNGWKHTPEGTCYLLESGEKAKGVCTIDGKQYTFSNTGYLMDIVRNNNPVSIYRDGISIS